ncbi:hypothetical protein GSI_01262 [Ganoderma sinense ZZ0214-1]|uniref:Uncharacterized protein n=1 Tax=Ganoderma sinense ZZ0214-1 TaxID=1077348 RepID=A0A2G8SVE9_9APHY|nr:hypothetical protein GSI_01262 [Ganoderma sinense ZZ0214-1]
MAPPVVAYVAAAVATAAALYAFTKFVYEPVIAPKLETWAENFLEKRKQKKIQQGRSRQNPVLAQPTNARTGETSSARSSSDSANAMSIELERLAQRERNEWGQSASSSGLRHRRPTAVPEESCPRRYVIFDTSLPSSPGGQSIRTSVLPSLDNSPAYPSMSLSEPSEPQQAASKSLTPSPQVMSLNVRPLVRQLPVASCHPSPTMLLERSPLSMRQLPGDLSASLPVSTSYNTPLGGSLLSEAGAAPPNAHPLSSPGRMVRSPDDVRSPSMASDLTLDSDEDFDVMSPRSGMFSPTRQHAHADDDPFEVGSQHESEASWTSVGPHSPANHF